MLAGPILDVEEILHNEHVLTRGMVASYEHPSIGRFGAVPVPFKFDGFRGWSVRPCRASRWTWRC